MKNLKKQGFTLVEIMIVVMIIGLLAAIALPGFQRARESAQGNACINNQRIIDSAVDQYAIDEGLETDDEAAMDDILEYMKDEPTCPVGDTEYGDQVVGEDAECPNEIEGHDRDPDADGGGDGE